MINSRKIREMLNNEFYKNFENSYKQMKIKNKNAVLTKITQIYSKWSHSTLLEDTAITPSLIFEYSEDNESVYTTVRGDSTEDFKGLTFTDVKYDLEDHPICRDFRIIVERFKKGAVLNGQLELEFEEVNEIEGLTNYDFDYATYLIMIALDLGYIKKIPSVGVDIYRTTEKIKELEDLSNRKLLDIIFNEALDISATFLSDNFFGRDNIVTTEMVMSWLTNPIKVDEIFVEAYKDDLITGPPNSEAARILEGIITTRVYQRGISIDKWFLTPFGVYFRFIDSVYMYLFSHFDEMCYIANRKNQADELGQNEVADTAIYSPSSIYRITKLGGKFLNMEEKVKTPRIFEKMSVEKVVGALVENDDEKIEDIICAYQPEFNVYKLKLTFTGKDNKWMEMSANEDMTLEALHVHIAKHIGTGMLVCNGYRFYKLPLSPFTEYMPSFYRERGPSTEDSTLGFVLDENDTLYYELELLGEKEDVTYKVEIQVLEIGKGKWGIQYPIESGFYVN